MKIIASLILTLLCIGVFGQMGNGLLYDWKLNSIVYSPIHYSPSSNVHQIDFEEIKKKKTEISTKKYNADGKLIEYTFMNKNGNSVPVAKLKYENSEVNEIKYYRKGKLNFTTTYTNTEKGDPLKKIKVNSKNKTMNKMTWLYNEEGCLIEYKWYGRGGEKAWTRSTYEYHENCEKSKLTVYNRKGKIKNVWTYDCKKEGEILQKKKNVTQVCKWEETSSDILTKVYQSFDEKGKIIKNISKYTLADTLILEWTRYNDKDELINKNTYDKNYNRPLITAYFKNGKNILQYEYRYENELVTYTSYTNRGKLHHRSEYIYNDEDLLKTFINYNKKGIVKRTVNLTYSN